MTKVLPLPDEPKKAYYLEDWDKAKGYSQPLPFAEGKSITLGVDDALARVNVVSDTANLMLFDGRDPKTGSPIGKPFVAYRFSIRADVAPYFQQSEHFRNGVAVITMRSTTSNMWLQSLPD